MFSNKDMYKFKLKNGENMKKVLKTFSKLNAGGAEVRTLEMITEINNRQIDGIEFHIIALSGEAGILDNKFKEQGVKIHYIKLKNYKFLFEFIKLINKEKINVLYSNIFLFSGVFMLLGRILNVPLRISHIRTLFDEKETKFRKFRNYFLKNLIIKYSTYIIGVNKAVLSRNFKRFELNNSQYKVLFNGIKSRKQMNTDTKAGERINIIHIGRQVPAKNHIKLLEIFIEVNKFYPESTLHLIGQTNEKINEKILDVIKKYKIEKNVKILGVRDDVSHLLNNKNIMIFPSMREGLPGVVLEALACGVPVLASNIEPHQELVSYFTDVTVMDLNDSNINWAKKTLEICHSKEYLNSSNIIEEFNNSPFNLKNHVDEYLKIINVEVN